MLPPHRGAFFARLSDPALYLRAAQRVQERQRERGSVELLVDDGPALVALHDLPGLARRLAREVARGSFTFAPVVSHVAVLGGKPRTLYRARPLDVIVQSALASLLVETLEPFLSDRVFSYRPGRSARSAIGELSRHLRAHAAVRPDPRTRGLYVLRRDIASYGDAIAAAEHSQLWSLLAEAIERAHGPITREQLAWLRSAFRPAVRSSAPPRARSPARGRGTEVERSLEAAADSAFEVGVGRMLEEAPVHGSREPTDAGTFIPPHGIPTGSPLQPCACNLYLAPIDRLAEAMPGGFYARYGDDILFAHPEAGAARELQAAIDRLMRELELEPSADKCGEFYFNGAARESPSDRSFRPIASLDYLGVRVGFGGVLALKRDKCTALLRDVRRRLEASAPLLRDAPEPERTRALCAVANSALDPSDPSAHPSAVALLQAIDDRSFLRDLDHKLALSVAEVSAARRGVRAFRTHPPARLRALGLGSIVQARNLIGRERP